MFLSVRCYLLFLFDLFFLIKAGVNVKTKQPRIKKNVIQAAKIRIFSEQRAKTKEQGQKSKE